MVIVVVGMAVALLGTCKGAGGGTPQGFAER